MATDEMLCAQLMKAAKTGNVKEVKKLLHKGALFTKDEYGNNALHEAAWNGHADVAKLLLKSSCFADSINKNGCTPLHLAAQNGHAKVVQMLLKFKADASILNQQGEAAVHLAVKYNHLDLMMLFTAAINIETKEGLTPLHIAAKHGCVGMLRTLLLLGADPYRENKKGVSAISIAEDYGQQDAAKLLKNSEDITSSSILELSMTSRAKRSLRFSRSVWKPAKDMWHQVRRRSRSGSRDSLNEDKTLLKERKRLDLSSASTTALAGSQLGSPDHSSLRSSPIQNISGLSSSNEECSSSQSSNRQSNSDAIVEKRRCNSLDGMLNKDDTPALPNHSTTSDPKHTSTPIPSPNNDSTGYITMVPVKFDSPSDKHTRLSSEVEKKHKKAIINSVPVEVNRLHEPNIRLAPKKSILSQPPQSKKRADIQEELDTMKTAFEIRLSQIEKRYQRQLWLATEQANMERYNNRRPSPLPIPWGQYYHQPQRGYPPHHQSKHLSSLPSRPAAETWQGNCRKRLFSDEGGGYCSDDENLRHYNYGHGYTDPKYYYDSDDSLSEQLSPEYPEEFVFPEDDLELLHKKPWFEENDSPNGSIRSGRGNRESKKISPHEHSETKKAIREKLAYYHEKIRQHYQGKSAQRYKQYVSDVDKSDSTITTTRLQQLEQRIQELECSLQNQTLV